MSAAPRIAMFGSSLVSAYWNGAATYYRGLIRALNELGYRTTFYEPDAYDRQKHRDIPNPEWADVVVYPATDEGVQRALERAADADILVKASGVGVYDEFLEAAVAGMKSPSRTIIFWDVDAPATLDRMASNPADPFRKHVPQFDLIFTYGGGDPVVRAYEAFGARQCVPVYNGFDPDIHHCVAPDPRFAGLLGFLGNRLPDREARVHEFFLSVARALPDETFILGGNGWESGIDLPPNVRAVGHVFSRDHNAFNCTPRAVININRDSMARYGYSPPTRVFEAAGAGACLICDDWEGLDTFLEPQREVLPVQSGEDVASIIKSLDADTARRIGTAARRRVLANHTYSQRAQLVDAVLEGRSIVQGSQQPGEVARATAN